MDADSVNFIDTTASDALLVCIKELQARGIAFGAARVRDEVRERMRLGGVETAIWPNNFYEHVTDGACLAAAVRNPVADLQVQA